MCKENGSMWAILDFTITRELVVETVPQKGACGTIAHVELGKNYKASHGIECEATHSCF